MNAHALGVLPEPAAPAWAAAVASHLGLVEKQIERTISSDVPTAYDVCSHLRKAGGKRMRPALAILSGLCLNPASDENRLVDLAAATELFHMASLVHDDVIDETTQRRGAATANSKWGNKLSVLSGDFLLSKAFTLLASDCDREIIAVLSATAVGMTESEILQASSEGSVAAWESNYWKIIRGKTASFMAACCECGAIIAGANASDQASMAEFGLQLGYAFQITDDLLDITGDPGLTGKAIGTDLVNGKFTLPVLLVLESLACEQRKTMAADLGVGYLTPRQASEIALQIVESGGVDKARARAMECTEKALAQLTCLPDSLYKASLEDIARSVTNRTL